VWIVEASGALCSRHLRVGLVEQLQQRFHGATQPAAGAQSRFFSPGIELSV